MRRLFAFFIFILFNTSAFAQDQQEPNDSDGEIRYISDDLYTYMHAGPGRNYRILGSVLAGTRVIQLQIDAENNFVEIIDDRQRTGWVDAEFITLSQSVRDMVPQLQDDLRRARAAVDEEAGNTQMLSQQISDLTSQNRQLTSQLEELRTENASIQQRLDTQDQSAQMEWFTRGGIVALVGILLGVIIAYLPKKRRRNDQWM